MPNADQLRENAPPRQRALAEAALVLVTVFLPANLGAFGMLPLAAITTLLAAWGLLLLHPWTEWRSGQRGRAIGCVLLFGLALGAAMAPVWFGEAPEPPPRLGVRHTSVTLNGDGQPGRKAVELTHVEPGLPADGVLEAGDRILAVDGEPLSGSDPEADFQKHIREAGGGASTDVRFTLERKGETREVTAHIGPARKAVPFKPGSMTWLCLRALGMSLLVALLVWRDGQGPAQLGLVREGLVRELLLGIPVTLGAYTANIAAAIPLAALAALLKLGGKEALARKEVATALMETGLGLPTFAAAMLIVTGFEELTFRGFLVPRLQVLLGHWYAAALVSAALFGLGHFYEGTFAVFQTAVLGAYFGVVFVHRARLPSVWLAHAAFNTLNFALMMWLQRSGLFEKLTG
ncbi:type II CAAX prenyl endopeptidase Rce1 family protein [Vitiosangium sp. GDMCC 1.1324]|uniref:CPBP family glutamic-type intramembrane protease n=1 Tax=Vitiosangium sp. (strain GDMCC 1.1324) TaxID=2138576 RepID=UPI000D3954DB|nr:CPBP family glutamic-type intramembrane protease [Vitiosangium sp. GDMCC 1.1324]PTL84100.1 CPBP family intramembrane metalloprotease domain-containing protein [Vitiosangium sp. GDMCC 1.1324]